MIKKFVNKRGANQLPTLNILVQKQLTVGNVVLKSNGIETSKITHGLNYISLFESDRDVGRPDWP